MSNIKGGLIGAIIGFVIQAWRYINAIPDGLSIDYSGMAGAGAAGALIGAIIGGVAAILIRVLRRKN